MRRRMISLLLVLTLAFFVVPAAAAESIEPAEETASVSFAEKAPGELADTAVPPEDPQPEEPAEPVPDEEPTEEPTDPPQPQQQPIVPKIRSATVVAKGVKLSWNEYPGADRYRVFYLLPDTLKWKTLGYSAATTFTHTNPVSDTEYIYTVRAVDADNNFISDFDREGYRLHYLAAPALLSLTNTNKGQKLVWEAVDGATSFRVYWQIDGEWERLAVSDTASYTNTNVEPGKSYTYSVRCIDPVTDKNLSYYVKSGISAVFVAQPQITGFSSIKGGTRISWNGSEGAVKYRLFIKDTETEWKKVGDTAGLSIDHTGLVDCVTYTYTVRALDQNGKYISGYDKAGSSRTYLAPPKIDEITAAGDGVRLSWSASPYAAGYRVYRRAFLSSWVNLGFTTDTVCIDRTAQPDVLYTYTLRYADENDRLLSYFTDTGVYYVNGAPANGKYTVNGYPITFKNGRFQAGYVKKDSKQYYFDASGKIVKNNIVGSKKLGYTYADKNGVCCTSKEIRLAAAFMAEHCEGNTLQEKMRSGFMFLAKNFPYKRTYDHPKTAADIPPLAIDMFENECGNCFRYAACFTCIAKIAGYRTRIVIGTANGSPHGWVEVLVDGKWLICDPDAQLPGYGHPAYAAYMMKSHKYWKLAVKSKIELTISSSGKAIWKKV